jgi:hypothetical protein
MAKSKTITGTTYARESAIQRRLIALIERKYQRQYRREITRATKQIAGAETGRDRMQFEDMHRANMGAILRKNWNETFNTFGARVITPDQKSAWFNVERKDFMLDPATQYRLAIERWLAKYGGLKLTEIVGTTLKDAQSIVAKAVEQAVANNLSESETGALIREMINNESAHVGLLRSRIIARTETHAASQTASFEAAKASGVDVKKVWSSTMDPDRTRTSHLIANGQEREMDEYFDVGGQPLMYPGDPNGLPENVINCRCINLIVPK